MKNHLLGFDIGGTKCAAMLGRRDTKNDVAILAREEFATASTRAPLDALGRLCDLARMLAQHENIEIARDVAAVGISCGGPLDSRRGVVQSPPNLPGWDEVPVCEYSRNALGLPAQLQNDANACALAEWRWGAGRGSRNMIFLTFGTGLGAGLILDEKLYSGTNDMAGEVGHVRLADDGPEGYGKRGSFEGFCSGGGIARLAQNFVREKWARGETVAWCDSEEEWNALSARVLAEAARDGDTTAREIYGIAARKLGAGLAILVDVLNPEIIVIGSVFTRARDLLWPEAQRVLRAEALPQSLEVCRVVGAELGERIGDYGALSIAAACAEETETL